MLIYENYFIKSHITFHGGPLKHYLCSKYKYVLLQALPVSIEDDQGDLLIFIYGLLSPQE